MSHFIVLVLFLAFMLCAWFAIHYDKKRPRLIFDFLPAGNKVYNCCCGYRVSMLDNYCPGCGLQITYSEWAGAQLAGILAAEKARKR